MPNCKEFFLDDAMAITAIPVSKISTASPNSPALALTPTISHDFTQYFDADTITIGQVKVTRNVGEITTAYGILIPIMRGTGKAKDDESDQTAGRLHKVTVNCQIDDRDPSVWTNLLTLERTPSHLLLTFRDKSRAFVQANKDTYLCTVDRDGAKTSVQFRIECLIGIQMLV